MKTAQKSILAFTVVSLMLFVAGNAQADWNPGDPYKMHYPQLPDPTGWDVLCTDSVALSDDWQCSQTGPVRDIHIWGSWKEGEVAPIDQIFVYIFDNIPAGGDVPFSQPGELLWDRIFIPDQFTLRDYGNGEQGWYDPTQTSGGWVTADHFTYHQINIENIVEPFVQEQDKIYWLTILVWLNPDYPFAAWGWKTSLDHFEDDAVWIDTQENSYELRDPVTGESLDLAFVITPEPATLALMLLGGLVLLNRKKSTGAAN